MDYNKLFKNWNNYLFEARIDKIIAKYPDYEDEIKQLSANDPSGNDKYLGWMVKQIPVGYGVESISDIVNDFHENLQRLDKKDIYQWKFEALRDKLDSLGTSKSQKKKEIKEEGTVKIHEDEDYLIVAPLTVDASCKYGAGTKWCISAKDNNYFNRYALMNNVNFIFVFDKNRTKKDPLYKIALVYYDIDILKAYAQSNNVSLKTLLGTPQEVYDATDKLKCKLSGVESPLLESIIVEQSNKCEQFLDKIFRGQWVKYKNIIGPKMSHVRSSLYQANTKTFSGLLVDIYQDHKRIDQGMVLGDGNLQTFDGKPIEINSSMVVQPIPVEELTPNQKHFVEQDNINYPFSIEETFFLPKYKFVFKNENGQKKWILNGKLHREAGPALESADGAKYWYISGEFHRVGYPAIVHPSGEEYWYISGKLHRTDGPAAVWAPGEKRWFVDGKLHRTDGPAAITADGKKGYYLLGNNLDYDEWKKLRKTYEIEWGLREQLTKALSGVLNELQ